MQKQLILTTYYFCEKPEIYPSRAEYNSVTLPPEQRGRLICFGNEKTGSGSL
jgi:hypothetical protein